MNIPRTSITSWPATPSHSKWLFWVLESAHAYLESISVGSTFPAISGKDLENLRIPSSSTPSVIADYLDHETAEIDTFIAEIDRAAELASERLAAMQKRLFASHTATTTARLRHVADLASGSGFPIDRQGDATQDIPFFKVGSLAQAADGLLTSSSNTVSKRAAHELGARIFPPGTIVMAKIGAALYLNRNARLARPSSIDNNMLGVVPKAVVAPAFLQHTLSTMDLAPLGNPGALPSLNIEWLKESRTSLPERSAQEAIVHEYDELAAQHASLTNDLSGARSLAQERRIALISAAVTGQIDVTQKHRPVAEQLEDEVKQLS